MNAINLKKAEQSLQALTQKLWGVKEDFISIRGLHDEDTSSIDIAPYNISIGKEVSVREKEQHEYTEYQKGILIDVCGDNDQIILIHGPESEDWDVVCESRDWVY